MLKTIQNCNEGLEIQHIDEESFQLFGRVHDNFPKDRLIAKMKDVSIPTEGNVYEPANLRLETAGDKEIIENAYYGGMPVQIGYCVGQNSHLGGLEFHKGSEFNIAVTDMVLLIGHFNDIKDHTFSTEHLRAFFVPEGYVVELFQTTLHLAPCKVSENGFKTIVILPEGTNTPLSHAAVEQDPLLFKRNKWLLSHKEHQRFVSEGAHIGIKGPNVFVNYLMEREGGRQR
ncbi:DUF4867 family protein [Halobacillus litoralis]|uniref:DUF4867 family protein n=1 Tax=Halobacillus litoralis TaxID=45668 RepID=UPI001CD526B2|nr:DUF4867 family protein [Halobacillus litoralis]MCA1021188.1 DUF4867 family protein [Halobacillus litoralis]